ncbi:MAG: radical SAM family heme chaperone HemW [Desulfonauticus sp.]|nr:radical SAM family heme chaperone HemW [Desulfonauticus sp.]
MLLYIHVPFCIKKCNYCAFFSQQYVPEMAALYLSALRQELKYWASKFNSPRVQSIYVGGGTPSLLKEKELDPIINDIYKYFSVEPKIEFTLEANPESTKNKSKVTFWLQSGINRISLGIQSFEPYFLSLLGRAHSGGDIYKSFNLLRSVGFKNLNIDLMFGLPGQSIKHWLEELKKGINLKPEHISCYNLTLEAGTYLAEHKKQLDWPEDDKQAKMYVYGAEYLESCGYLQYEISNFSKMGYRCLHNLGYWEGIDFLGLGPSAVSTINEKRWQQPANIKNYFKAVQNGFRNLEIEYIQGTKKINEFIMLSLRTTRGLNLKKFQKLTGINFFKRFQPTINLLYKHRLISIKRDYLSLTKTGMVVSDSIIPKFFLTEKNV